MEGFLDFECFSIGVVIVGADASVLNRRRYPLYFGGSWMEHEGEDSSRSLYCIGLAFDYGS